MIIHNILQIRVHKIHDKIKKQKCKKEINLKITKKNKILQNKRLMN